MVPSRIMSAAQRTRCSARYAQGVVFSTERFQSLATEDKLLSLSVWENEEAIETWRNQIDHRMSQAAGRGSIFASYDITVLKPLRRYFAGEAPDRPKRGTAL